MQVWGIPLVPLILLFPNNSLQCLDGEVSYLRIVLHAEVAKLADALASGASSRKGVEVQVLSSAFKFKAWIIFVYNFQAEEMLESLFDIKLDRF